MLILIGSQALKFHGRLKNRDAADWDIIVSYDNAYIDNNSLLKNKVELYDLSGTNWDIYKYCLSLYKTDYINTIETPIGEAIVAPLEILKVLKLSCHAFLDKAKHSWDLEQLKDIKLNTYLMDLTNRRSKEVALRVQKQKLEFFNKYSIPRYVDHDLIHSYIAENPMYLRILDNAVDVSEEKFNKLTEFEKRDLIREECLVLSLERELIPSFKKMPMLAKCLYKKFLETNTSNTTAMRWLSRMSIESKIKDHPTWATKWTKVNIDFILDGFNVYWKDKVEKLPVVFWEELLK